MTLIEEIRAAFSEKAEKRADRLVPAFQVLIEERVQPREAERILRLAYEAERRLALLPTPPPPEPPPEPPQQMIEGATKTTVDVEAAALLARVRGT